MRDRRLPLVIEAILNRDDEFPVLTDDEFLKLESWLAANPRTTLYLDGRDDYRKERKRRLQTICEYNLRLRANAEPAKEVTQGEKPKTKAPAPRRGRKKLPANESNHRQEILTAWGQAKGAGVKRKDFCADKEMTVNDLENYLRCEAQRKNRAAITSHSA